MVTSRTIGRGLTNCEVATQKIHCDLPVSMISFVKSFGHGQLFYIVFNLRQFSILNCLTSSIVLDFKSLSNWSHFLYNFLLIRPKICDFSFLFRDTLKRSELIGISSACKIKGAILLCHSFGCDDSF